MLSPPQMWLDNVLTSCSTYPGFHGIHGFKLTNLETQSRTMSPPPCVALSYLYRSYVTGHSYSNMIFSYAEFG